MNKQIFINLAVSNLEKSMEFYTALGFSNNPQFSDETAKCMVWSESIFVMLLTSEKFSSFATKPIADTKTKVAALFSLALENIEAVNKMMADGLLLIILNNKIKCRLLSNLKRIINQLIIALCL